MGIVDVNIGGFSFDLIDGDEISENIIDGDIEIVVPIYGDPYIRNNNPVSKGYTENTISLEGPSSSFNGLVSRISDGVFDVTSISIGTHSFFNCIVIGVSSQTNVTQSMDRIKGQIKIIRM